MTTFVISELLENPTEPVKMFVSLLIRYVILLEERRLYAIVNESCDR